MAGGKPLGGGSPTLQGGPSGVRLRLEQRRVPAANREIAGSGSGTNQQPASRKARRANAPSMELFAFASESCNPSADGSLWSTCFVLVKVPRK